MENTAAHPSTPLRLVHMAVFDRFIAQEAWTTFIRNVPIGLTSITEEKVHNRKMKSRRKESEPNRDVQVLCESEHFAGVSKRPLFVDILIFGGALFQDGIPNT